MGHAAHRVVVGVLLEALDEPFLVQPKPRELHSEQSLGQQRKATTVREKADLD